MGETATAIKLPGDDDQTKSVFDSAVCTMRQTASGDGKIRIHLWFPKHHLPEKISGHSRHFNAQTFEFLNNSEVCCCSVGPALGCGCTGVLIGIG
jgi:hypothetical protein